VSIIAEAMKTMMAAAEYELTKRRRAEAMRQHAEHPLPPPANLVHQPNRLTSCSYCRRDWSPERYDNCPSCGAPPKPMEGRREMSEEGYMIVQIRDSEGRLEWQALVPNVVLCKRPADSDTLTLHWGWVEKDTLLDPDLGIEPTPPTLECPAAESGPLERRNPQGVEVVDG